MTNAPDFSLDAELADTDDWDEETSDRAEAPEPERYGDVDPEETTGEQDLAERHALRRVAGLRTELEDITEVEYRQLRLERVVLVGVWTEGGLADAENSLVELKRLAETAGSQVLDGLIQRRNRPDAATYVGSGKAREVRDIAVPRR